MVNYRLLFYDFFYSFVVLYDYYFHCTLFSGIPSFHILDENLKTINDEGRGAVGADPEGKEFPWIPKPLNPLLGHTAGKVNSCATLIYLTGKHYCLSVCPPVRPCTEKRQKLFYRSLYKVDKRIKPS